MTQPFEHTQTHNGDTIIIYYYYDPKSLRTPLLQSPVRLKIRDNGQLINPPLTPVTSLQAYRPLGDSSLHNIIVIIIICMQLQLSNIKILYYISMTAARFRVQGRRRPPHACIIFLSAKIKKTKSFCSNISSRIFAGIPSSVYFVEFVFT